MSIGSEPNPSTGKLSIVLKFQSESSLEENTTSADDMAMDVVGDGDGLSGESEVEDADDRAESSNLTDRTSGTNGKRKRRESILEPAPTTPPRTAPPDVGKYFHLPTPTHESLTIVSIDQTPLAKRQKSK